MNDGVIPFLPEGDTNLYAPFSSVLSAHKEESNNLLK